MNVKLSAKTRRWIDVKMKSGRYRDADDVICASLAALEQQEHFGDFAPGELDELLAEGERSIKVEGTIDAAEVFAELRARDSARAGTNRKTK